MHSAVRVDIKKPAQKNKKIHLLNTKNPPASGFFGYLKRSLCFVKKFAFFPLKGR
jgi:hypothetical protein